VQDGAVGPDAVLLRRDEFILVDEMQVGLPRPALEKILKGFGNDAFG
jgi:hypothetical protein